MAGIVSKTSTGPLVPLQCLPAETPSGVLNAILIMFIFYLVSSMCLTFKPILLPSLILLHKQHFISARNRSKYVHDD